MQRFSSIFVFLAFAAVSSAPGQTANGANFMANAQVAVSGGRSFHTINLTATAEWSAGSLHESGTAQLQANTDGSTNVQLSLDKASRSDVQTKLDSSRACQWTDRMGTSHEVLGANCYIAIPWFAPSLFTQSASQLPSLLTTTDDGVVSKDNTTFHQMSFLFNGEGTDTASTQRLLDASKVKVFYDPQTYLPASLEYKIHPDNNDRHDLEVRVVFSNYQSVSGIMLPFHIEKYVLRSLQLKLDVSNATIE